MEMSVSFGKIDCMYQPKRYKKEDPEYIYDFIEQHPFATMVIRGDQLLATHIPVLITGTPLDFTLYAHIANHNEQFDYLKDGIEALLIFQGAQGYVSSSWYKEKNISTWDYSAVHVNVKLKLQSRDELANSLSKLVHKFEKNQESPLYFEDYPHDMVEDHIKEITGFWCHPVRVQAIAKLHQGYDKDDVISVTKNLEKGTCPVTGDLAQNIKKEHGI